MTRYLIEVTHENKKDACDRAARVFQETGSHFLINADWGCSDDVHKAWFIVDVDSKEEALLIVPPPFRQAATAIALQKFGPKDVEATRKQHGA